LAFGLDLWRVPREMDAKDIREVQKAFTDATKRALEAGYLWLELHAAHGYLCHSFSSPLSNHRTDEYGGTFNNRIRFVLETFSAMREVWPEHLPFGVRLSCSDWVEGGWTIEESVDLSKRLKERGADLIDCSSGFGSPDHKRYPFGPGWQVPFAEAIRREAGVATAAVGFITEPVQADEIIRKGQADLVLLARQLLREPYWPYRAAAVLNAKDRLDAPPQYARAM
jgi:2,4-dienoyl-CoA reductase-like NADH-dependent reductase (Old Yellow Enzyme family)